MEMCACSKKMVDRDNANYVFRGQPCCGPTCYRAAEARFQARQRVLQARAARDVPMGQSWAFTGHRDMGQVMREENTRIVGSFEDGFHVVG